MQHPGYSETIAEDNKRHAMDGAWTASIYWTALKISIFLAAAFVIVAVPFLGWRAFYPLSLIVVLWTAAFLAGTLIRRSGLPDHDVTWTSPGRNGNGYLIWNAPWVGAAGFVVFRGRDIPVAEGFSLLLFFAVAGLLLSSLPAAADYVVWGIFGMWLSGIAETMSILGEILLFGGALVPVLYSVTIQKLESPPARFSLSDLLLMGSFWVFLSTTQFGRSLRVDDSVLLIVVAVVFLRLTYAAMVRSARKSAERSRPL